MNIYVGNLPYSTEKEELEDVFAEFGEIESIDIIVDRRSGRSRGYGFVSMPNEGEAKEAVETLNGREFDGRNLRVDFSRPKQKNRPDHQNKRQQNQPVQQNTTPEKSGGIVGFIKRIFS
ncbi:MAG: RNA recognition motif domain-containing protein [Gammaproteobacteria bacterium]